MKISVGTWVFLLCCLLSSTRCVGNSLSERNPPYAAESGGSEGDLVLHEDNEEGESNGQNVPPHLLLGQGSNNQQQNVRNEEVASESQRNLNEVQRNRTVDRHNTSRGGNANTDDQVSAVGDSSSYDRGNDISISKNDSDADLQNGIHSHGDNNRDQSSNINFAPHAQELDPDVKITAMPAPSPEIQNRLLPRETTNPANLAGHVASHNPEQFNNDTDGPENSMNTTTRQPTITKENKYRTKGEISETTPPDKDHHQPEVTESTDFPQASLMTESITYSRTPTNENMTQHSSTPNSEMLTTTGIRSTLPTEEKDFLRTTFPQEQVHSGVFLSTILSSGRFHSTTTISNEEVKETRTLFPPSERVPEVSIRIPTEIITPEPTEPVFTTTAHVTEAPEGGSGDHERPNYPDETISQVTLRFFTYPMEITSSTPVPVTETVNSNVKISPTQFEPVTEKKDNKVTKGGPELNTKLSSTKDNSTVTTVRSTRYGHGGDSVTESNTGSGRTFFSTASHSPEIQNVNNTPSSTQSSSSHVTVKNSFQTNSETLSTRFSESQFTGTISTNFDKSMPHSSVLTVNYPTSTTQTVATSTSGFTKGISRSLQNFTSATMESNTLGSTSGTTPNAYGTPSQRDTTINLQNITISTSRSTTPLGNATLSFTTRNSAQYNVTTGRPSVTARPTTKKPNMTTTSTTKKPTEYPKATEKPSDAYSTSPVVPPKYYICFQFLWRLNEFCLEKSIFKKDLTTIMKRKANKSFEETQIKFINELCYDKATENKTAEVDEFKDTNLIKVELYFTDNQGKFDVRLTVDSSEFLRKDLTSQSRYVRKLVDVQLINLNVNDDRKDYQEKGISSGMTIAVIIVIIGGICCVCLIILQILMHKQNEKASRNILAGPNRFSLRSLDSIALNAVPKSRPHSGFWNHGLDRSEENISSLSNPLGFNSLSNMTRDMVEIYKEFEKLPNEMPSLSCVPIGAEDKNRFANVIPLSHSRVKLKKLPHEEHSEYINANFLTGYNGDVHAYIATQAPLTNTIKDFWRMVWEQQSRVIIMLMTVNETTQPRDPAYVPDTEGVNGRVKYGDIVLVLKKKEVRQEYIMSLLEVKDIENNLIREIRHFWFTSWPLESNPEPISVIKLILDTRVHYEDSGAPLVVHCSSGTGRSGTMIAIDICMRSYESKRVVDILGCVNNMRKERAGLVQNKEQYALIYKTLNEYAVIMGSPRLAPSSSSAIQLQHML